MKRLIILLSFILVASIAMAVNVTKEKSIKLGATEVTGGFSFTASDTLSADDTLTLYIVNKQKYFQHQTFTIALAQVTVTPSVVITAYGRVTSTSTWTQIGTPITWTTSANNGSITSTTPANYNYLKVECVASSASQLSKITAFEVRTANCYDIPANSGTLTISRATSGTVTVTTKDDDANAAAVYRAGGTGALTLGAATGTTAITSSDWAIDATGIATGMGVYNSQTISSAANFTGTLTTASTTKTTTDGDNVILDASTDLHAIDVQINSASKFSADTLGNVVAAGSVTATGGLVIATQPSIYWAAGGSVALATAGTDVACANGNRFWVEINIPYNSTITGLSYLIGSVGGTDSVVVQLCNSAGVQVATSRAVGGAAALVGTAANLQNVPFTAPYAAVAGRYFAVVQFNGTTAKFRAYPIPGSKFIANTAAGTWGTKADITPGTSFVADKGPIIQTY